VEWSGEVEGSEGAVCFSAAGISGSQHEARRHVLGSPAEHPLKGLDGCWRPAEQKFGKGSIKYRLPGTGVQPASGLSVFQGFGVSTHLPAHTPQV